MRERIAAIIEQYSGQGVHRTGTEGDRISAEWLRQRIRELGVDAVEEPMAFSRLEVEQAFIEVGEDRFDGVPCFDRAATDATGIVAPLCWAESGSGGIAAAVIRPQGGESSRARRTLEGDDPFVAGVAITDPEWMPTGLGLLNAPRYSRPGGMPVLQLPAEAHASLRQHVDRGAAARLVIATHRVPTTVYNVGASIPGTRAAREPLVVMTPRSGWWSCAQERGGGIAAFLEAMRAVAASPRRRDVLFTANTGHELGHLGLGHFLRSRPGLIRGAHCWIHLGANFAANNERSLVLQFSSAELREHALAQFARHGLTADGVRGPGERPAGEAMNIFDGGGQYISLLGYGHYFHHPDDVWPHTVDVDKTARVVEALCELTLELADSD